MLGTWSTSKLAVWCGIWNGLCIPNLGVQTRRGKNVCWAEVLNERRGFPSPSSPSIDIRVVWKGPLLCITQLVLGPTLPKMHDLGYFNEWSGPQFCHLIKTHYDLHKAPLSLCHWVGDMFSSSFSFSSLLFSFPVLVLAVCPSIALILKKSLQSAT